MTAIALDYRMQTRTNVGVQNAVAECVDGRENAERTFESPFHFSLRDPHTLGDQRQPTAYLAVRQPAGRSASCSGRLIPVIRHRTWRLTLGKPYVGK